MVPSTLDLFARAASHHHTLQTVVETRLPCSLTRQGVGEGVALPSMSSLVSNFVPMESKAKGLGLCFTGFNTGALEAGMGQACTHAAGLPAWTNRHTFVFHFHCHVHPLLSDCLSSHVCAAIQQTSSVLQLWAVDSTPVHVTCGMCSDACSQWHWHHNFCEQCVCLVCLGLQATCWVSSFHPSSWSSSAGERCSTFLGC